MTSRRRDVLLLAAGWLVYLTGAVVWWVSAATPWHALAGVVPQGLLVLCGSIIVWRADERRIGWLLLWPGAVVLFFYPLGLASPDHLAGATDIPHQRALLALASLVLWPLMHLIIVFPSGRVASRAQRWLARAVGVVTVGGATLDVLADVGIVTWWLDQDVGLLVALPVFGAIVVGIVVDRVVRYRHQSHTERLQVKWFVAASVGWLLYPAAAALDLSTDAFVVVDAVATSLFPLAILVAITRYRLYAIDRIISRTLGYALVVAVLAVVAVAALAGLATVLPTQDGLATALATLAVLALFDPVRRRVLAAVDRRFDRRRYVARRVVEGFGHTVADVTGEVELRERLRDVLGATLAPATVAVWEPPPADRRGG